MKLKKTYKYLDELYSGALNITPKKEDKFVIFSDLHMGDGSSKDDFTRNAELFSTVLSKYYLNNDFKLVLNGDVEELQRFSFKKIFNKWSDIYALFDQFHARGGLIKTIGNHDLSWLDPNTAKSKYDVHDAVVLNFEKGDIFIFHGHQVDKKYQAHNRLVGYTLKYLANPLRIRNYSVAHDSRKQYAIEKKVYHYSAFKKKVSIIGHTHRPLFESLTKAERLINQIDNLCREYAENLQKGEMERIFKTIKSHKKEIKRLVKKERSDMPKFSTGLLYNTLLHIPCLFNSGCAIGKRGITCLEISHESISLIHWFDEKISKKYLNKRGYDPEQLNGTNYYKMVLNVESLAYVFNRIHLLS